MDISDGWRRPRAEQTARTKGLPMSDNHPERLILAERAMRPEPETGSSSKRRPLARLHFLETGMADQPEKMYEQHGYRR